MHLRTLPVTALRPAPYNPRQPLRPGSPAWNRLERSLREFDLVQPLVWNECTGHVVSGHQRLEILKHHGHTEVEVAVVDLPLDREKALNVTLNNANVGSDWEPSKLIDLLEDLTTLPDFDATLTGFDDQDLRNLLLTPEPELSQDEPESDQPVRVTLEIPLDAWPALRPHLDTLATQHPVRLHITLPPT